MCRSEELPVQRVCVIGAGPSGLVAIKTLREAGYEVQCLEASGVVGGTFVNKAYDDGKLVSSKYITPFSDFRLPESERDHQTMAGYVKYLNDYAEHFRLRPHIRFNCHVEKIDRDGSGRFVVRDSTGRAETYDAVAVCSGLHNIPYIPRIPGLDTFKGEVLHSSQYKTKEVFKDKRVVIMGAGETAMDLTYRAVQVATSVWLSVRTGFLNVPTEWGPVALDTLITNLFECCYVHPWVEHIHLKWKITTIFIRLGFLLFTGSSVGYNQWVGRLKEVKRGYHIINKSSAAMPYLNKRAKEQSWYGWMYKWLDGDVDRYVDTMPGISSVSGNTVRFSDGRSVEADMIVLATGYRQEFPFLPHTKSPTSANGDSMYMDTPEDPLPTERLIVNPSDPKLAYIGFARPNVGAIPPMAELQVMWWIQCLRGKLPRHLAPPTYELLGKRRVYGVDYGAYMHDLARDIGAAPHLSRWLTHPKVLIAYAFGQAYITFFRLEGPFATPDAVRIAETELFRPVVARGWIANAVFALIIMVFGAINMAAYAASESLSIVGRIARPLVAKSRPHKE